MGVIVFVGDCYLLVRWKGGGDDCYRPPPSLATDLSKSFPHLQMIHWLTSQRQTRLRIDMWDWEGQRSYAEYDYFRVDGDAEKFTVHVRGYHGNAGTVCVNVISSLFFSSFFFLKKRRNSHYVCSVTHLSIKRSIICNVTWIRR